MEDFFFLDYKNYDIDELLTRYFDGLLELCQWGAFDSLAHLTYPLRYIVAREKINVDMNKYQDVATLYLKNLLKMIRRLKSIRRVFLWIWRIRFRIFHLLKDIKTRRQIYYRRIWLSLCKQSLPRYWAGAWYRTSGRFWQRYGFWKTSTKADYY